MRPTGHVLARGLLATALALAPPAVPAEAPQTVTLASTTSVEHAGLMAHILPIFKAETGIEVRVVAQGTGQALETARRGDADLVLVHAPALEEAFLAQGDGVARVAVMESDFVIVGPRDDPAGVAAASSAAAALAAIAAAEAPFVSRGDDSGTHAAEMSLWQAAGVAPGGRWYRETGSGMGATLNTASQMNAYVLTDRATWLAFANPGALEILFEGDAALRNPYTVMLVNPERHPHVAADAARAFIDWLVSPRGQAAIASFRIDGAQPFRPAALPAPPP